MKQKNDYNKLDLKGMQNLVRRLEEDNINLKCENEKHELNNKIISENNSEILELKELISQFSSSTNGCSKTYLKDGEKYVCGSYHDKLLCEECSQSKSKANSEEKR